MYCNRQRLERFGSRRQREKRRRLGFQGQPEQYRLQFNSVRIFFFCKFSGRQWLEYEMLGKCIDCCSWCRQEDREEMGWDHPAGPAAEAPKLVEKQFWRNKKKNLRGRFFAKKEKRERFRSRRERTFLSVCPSVFCFFCVCISPSPQRCIFLTAADTSSRRQRRRRADRRRSSSRRGVVSLQRKRSLQKYRGLSSENWRMLPLLRLLLGRRPPLPRGTSATASAARPRKIFASLCHSHPLLLPFSRRRCRDEKCKNIFWQQTWDERRETKPIEPHWTLKNRCRRRHTSSLAIFFCNDKTVQLITPAWTVPKFVHTSLHCLIHDSSQSCKRRPVFWLDYHLDFGPDFSKKVSHELFSLHLNNQSSFFLSNLCFKT